MVPQPGAGGGENGARGRLTRRRDLAHHLSRRERSIETPLRPSGVSRFRVVVTRADEPPDPSQAGVGAVLRCRAGPAGMAPLVQDGAMAKAPRRAARRRAIVRQLPQAGPHHRRNRGRPCRTASGRLRSLLARAAAVAVRPGAMAMPFEREAAGGARQGRRAVTVGHGDRMMRDNARLLRVVRRTMTALHCGRGVESPGPLTPRPAPRKEKRAAELGHNFFW